MNIFVLHWKTRKAARWHCDKHVVKMILETTQMLYTAHWVKAYPSLRQYKSPIALSKYQKTLDVPEHMFTAPRCIKTYQIGYRPCHVGHPCTKWVRLTSGNYMWLISLGLELCKEFTHRFDNIHSCQKHLEWLKAHLPPNIKPYPRTPYAIAMGDEYKINNHAIKSYRNFYNTSKKERGLLKYTKRHPPHWLKL
jgi:hypothetical protein